MNYFSLPIIILSAVSLYLAIYYFILSIKKGLQKPYCVVSATCFFYFIYDCARIGIYNSQIKFWNYFWLYASLTTIPVIAICIVILVMHIFKYERISRHHDYQIIIGIYVMIAIGMIVESALLYPEIISFVIISGINNSPMHFNIHRGSFPYVILAFMVASIIYFFIRLYFYFRDNAVVIKRIMLILACLIGLFIFVIHDILITLRILPFYLFLGEYGIFFLIIMATSFSLDPHMLPELEASQKSGPGRDNGRYTHSLLADMDINDIREKLERAMAEDKLYMDPDITLRSLAGKLSISYHVLSQFLNTVIGMEFRNYINSFRVEEAMQLMASEPESSIISVCYNVGFQSKSAFNNAFKKHAGISPTEYKRSNSARK